MHVRQPPDGPQGEGPQGPADAPDPGPAPRRRRSRLATTAVVALYVLLAVAVYWHVWTADPGRDVQLSPDVDLITWFLRWTPFALAHGHNPFFTDYLNTPGGVNVLQNTSTPLLGLLAAPVTLLFGPVASYNLLMTLSLAASATAAYAVVRRFVAWHPAAVVAGLLYGFSPALYAASYTAHLQLSFAVLPPLIFWVLAELVLGQRRTPRFWGLVLAALVVAQFFVSTEVLTTTVLVALGGLVAAALVGRHRVAARAPAVARGLCWAAAPAAVVLAYPVWAALAGPAHITGAIQLEPQAYRADLLGLIDPDRLQALAPASLTTTSDRFATSFGENWSYLGLPLVLVVLAGAVWLRHRALVAVAALVGAGAYVLSLGGSLAVKGPPATYQSGLARGRLPLPGKLLAHLPLLSNVIPSRFALYVTLAASVVLAAVLDALHTRLAGWAGVVLPLALAAVALVPLVPAAPVSPVGDPGTPDWFLGPGPGRIPAGSVALLYPYPSALHFPVAQLWQAQAGLPFRMPGGYALVPGAGGRIAYNTVLGYTPLTLTGTVLTQLALGPAPPRTPSLRRRIRTELAGWKVRTVVATPAAVADWPASRAWLTWLLGPPRATTGGVTLWAGPGPGPGPAG